jgi:Spy/CpxP family protein refolding chaperone
MKLIDKMSGHPHFVEMMKERFAADAHGGGGSPYAGEEGRTIKALSDDQVKEYLEGEGMGLAKPAELNGYPGPRHVLDLSGSLKLTPEQSKSVRVEFDKMHADATRLGAQIVAEERAIDSLFRSNTMSQALLKDRIRKSASLQGELRLDHLRAHLTTRDLLTPEQRESYMVLRGYAQKSRETQQKQ